MSNRVVEVLEGFSPDIEVYSIDECFLYYPDWKHADYADIARHIR